MAERRPSVVITKTPLRVSFFGGGSDLKSYYSTNVGLTLSSTIDKYIYVFVKKHGEVFDEKIRLNYSDTELVNHTDEIQNNLIRSSLNFLNIDDRLYISTISDMPQKTGLGSSSAFLVGLLKALHHFKGESNIKPEQIAEEACQIEINILGSPIGKQDQYAAALGGANLLRFNADETVTTTSLNLYRNQFIDIFNNCLLVWSEKSRLAANVLIEQNSNSKKNENTIADLVSLAHGFFEALSRNAGEDFLVSSLSHSWNLKKSLASKIDSPEINKIFNDSMRLGALSAKILGAGGGGFLLCCVPHEKQEHFMKNINKTVVKLNFEPTGSTIIFSD